MEAQSLCRHPQTGSLPRSHAGAIGEAGTWQVAETTHIDGWVKKIRRGTIFKTESSSLYEVIEPIFISGMELRPEVTVANRRTERVQATLIGEL